MCGWSPFASAVSPGRDSGEAEAIRSLALEKAIKRIPQAGGQWERKPLPGAADNLSGPGVYGQAAEFQFFGQWVVVAAKATFFRAPFVFEPGE